MGWLESISTEPENQKRLVEEMITMMFKANFLGNVGSVKGNDQAEPGQGFLPSKEPKFVGELNKETIRLGVEATKWNI